MAKKITKLKVNKRAKKAAKLKGYMRTQHIINTLVDMHIAASKKRYPHSTDFTAIKDLAIQLGLSESFFAALDARPKVEEYSFTRVTEEIIDVKAQSRAEADALAIDEPNQRGSTIYLKMKRKDRRGR